MIACVNSAFDATLEHPIRKTHYTLILLSRFSYLDSLISIPYPDPLSRVFIPILLSRSLIQSLYPDPLSRVFIPILLSRSLIQSLYPDPLSRVFIPIPFESSQQRNTEKSISHRFPDIEKYNILQRIYCDG